MVDRWGGKKRLEIVQLHLSFLFISIDSFTHSFNSGTGFSASVPCCSSFVNIIGCWYICCCWLEDIHVCYTYISLSCSTHTALTPSDRAMLMTYSYFVFVFRLLLSISLSTSIYFCCFRWLAFASLLCSRTTTRHSYEYKLHGVNDDDDDDGG